MDISTNNYDKSPATMLLAAAKPVDTKSKGPGTCSRLCTRVWTSVKYIFSTLVYCITLTCIDLREKTALFAKQAGFHALTSLPKKAGMLEASIVTTIMNLPLVKDGKSFNELNSEESTTSDDKKLRATKATEAAKEIASAMTQAYKSGLRPVEYKVAMKDGKLEFQFFARASNKLKNLPSFTERSNIANAVAVSVDEKWDLFKYTTGKPPAISCYTRSITVDFAKLPAVAKVQNAQTFKNLEMLTAKCTKKLVTASETKATNPERVVNEDAVTTLKEELGGYRSTFEALDIDKSAPAVIALFISLAKAEELVSTLHKPTIAETQKDALTRRTAMAMAAKEELETQLKVLSNDDSILDISAMGPLVNYLIQLREKLPQCFFEFKIFPATDGTVAIPNGVAAHLFIQSNMPQDAADINSSSVSTMAQNTSRFFTELDSLKGLKLNRPDTGTSYPLNKGKDRCLYLSFDAAELQPKVYVAPAK